MGLWVKRKQQVVVRDLWRKYDWKQPHRLVVVQTGGSIDQAKVYKARAVPQGLCGNLINAVKLLANQQADGPLTDYCEEHGQREQRRSHGRSARTFKVRKPQVPEGCLR